MSSTFKVLAIVAATTAIFAFEIRALASDWSRKNVQFVSLELPPDSRTTITSSKTDRPNARLYVVFTITLRIDHQITNAHITVGKKESDQLGGASPREAVEQLSSGFRSGARIESQDRLSLSSQRLQGRIVKQRRKLKTIWSINASDRDVFVFARWTRPLGSEQYVHEVTRILNSLRISKH